MQSDLNSSARERFLATERRPSFLTSWEHVVLFHFAVDPHVLQPLVPFELDVFDGRAYASVVAFTQRAFRPALFPAISQLLTLPVRSYRFCNVRTYVRVGDEEGIFFLREWVSSPVAALAAPQVYGLPYAPAQLRYDYDRPRDRFVGSASAGGSRLALEASIQYDATAQRVRPGSLEEFVLDRYTGFTARGRRRWRFRIWHTPWTTHPAEGSVVDPGLLRLTGNWLDGAVPAGTMYCSGVPEVWIGLPRGMPGPAPAPAPHG